MTKEKEFTHDWFTNSALPYFNALKPNLKESNSVLEIGAFEGRATCWMLENIVGPEGFMYVVEPFTGAADHAEMDIDWKEVRRRFVQNTADMQFRFSLMDTTSERALFDLAASGKSFDFVYIDGSHRARDVLFDAVAVWPMVRKGGIVLFDDYLWGNRKLPLETPKPAIDAFTTIYGDELEIAVIGYQLGVRKLV